MPRRPVIFTLLAIPVGVGLIWKMSLHSAAAFMASHLEDRLLRLSDGKFTDPQHFVEMRLTDLALLTAGVCLVALAHLMVVPVINRRAPQRYYWVASTISGFVCLNVVAVMASHTAMFWCALYTGKNHTHNYTQYEIKSLLLKENPAPAQALLIGNSQTRAQMDPALLNSLLGNRLWTTELHFPGSRPYDIDLSFSKLPDVHPKFVICYVTEGYFYSGTDSEGLIYFQDWSDVPEFHHLGGTPSFVGKNFLYGLLGDTIPLFRLREPLTARLIGFRLLNLPQEQYNGALNVDLEDRAKQAATTYHLDQSAEFQKKSFLALSASCRERGAKLVLCVGQMNPVLGRALDPTLRPDMLRFLRQLAKGDSNVVLLDENELPKQTPDDYEDLTHCNPATKARFSEYLGGVLDKLLTNQSYAFQ